MFTDVFNEAKTLIGVIHLPALSGDSHYPLDKIIHKALVDLKTLEKTGFDGGLVENHGGPSVFSHDASISQAFGEVMKKLLKKAKIPLGLEIIYDMPGTVELAAKVGVAFVRLDVFVDSGKTKSGRIIQAEAEKIVKIKKALCPKLLLLTDIQVKHLTMLATRTVAQSAKEAVKEGSDAVIITGSWTSIEPLISDCIEARANVGKTPVFIGSGFSAKNAKKFLSIADGAILATSIKTANYLDPAKAKQLVQKVRKF